MDHDEEFAGYVAARWAGLVRSAVMLGCSLQEAEDVTQTTLTRCYLAWPRVRAADDVDAYVYRTLLNCWAKSRRRRWWGEQPTHELPDQPGDDLSDSVARRHDLVAALKALGPEQQAVVVLRFVADLTVPQIATTLGVPAGTVKSRLSRALDAINPELLHEEQP